MKKNLYTLLVALGVFCAAHAKQDTAVVVIDVQGDFTSFKDGSLAVPNSGEDYVKAVTEATKKLKLKLKYPIFATQDWHPKDDISFAENMTAAGTDSEGMTIAKRRNKKDLKQKPLAPFMPYKITIPKYNARKKVGTKQVTQVMWPVHCVQNSEGAKILVPGFLIDTVIQKGMNPDADSYSGFRDDSGQVTDLNDKLKKAGIKNLLMYGIATDYCVQATALHGRENGYNVALILDLSRGVAKATTEEARQKMKDAGVLVYETLDEFLQENPWGAQQK